VVLLLEVRHGLGSQVVRQMQVRQGNLRQSQDQGLQRQAQVQSSQPAGHVQLGAQHQVQPPMLQRWSGRSRLLRVAQRGQLAAVHLLTTK
jgi:hypothetical protein